MGAGKTNILPFFLSELSKRNVIIMQPNKKLAEQTYSDLNSSLSKYVEICKINETKLTVGKHITGNEIIGNVMIITPAYFKKYALDPKNIIIAD